MHGEHFCTIKRKRQIIAQKGCKFDDSLSYNDSSYRVSKTRGFSSPVISTKRPLHLPEIDTANTCNHKQNTRNTGVSRYNENHLPTRFLLSIGGISYGAEGGTWTRTVSLPTDFESVTSAIPSLRRTNILYHQTEWFSSYKCLMDASQA